MARCTFIKSNGKRCKANATRGSRYCFTHNPDYSEEKKLAVRKGGLNRKLYLDYWKPVEKPKDAKDIKGLLAELIVAVLNGELPAGSPLNSLAYLIRCFLDACERGEIEERLDDIEKKITSL